MTDAWAQVTAHAPLVHSVARRVVGRGRRLPASIEVRELVSVGLLGLFDAASRYEPDRGVPFEAFARPRVHGAMRDWLRRLQWPPRSVHHLTREDASVLDTLLDEADDPCALAVRADLRRRLAVALTELPMREQVVVWLSYDEGLTLAEIGEELRLGESMVSRIRTAAIQRLRARLVS